MRHPCWAALVLGALVLSANPAAAEATPDLSAKTWNITDIKSPLANQTATGLGVTVAVIDTGIDVDHPEFAGRLVSPLSWVCPTGVTVPCAGLQHVDDKHGHGTHVAGTVAAADDGVGVTGVAPDAKIMPLRVGDANGRIVGSLPGAFRYAVAQGADVITMSIGYLAGSGPVIGNPVFAFDLGLSDAIAEAQSAGVLVTLAAGNDAVPYCGQAELWQDAALCVGAYGTANDPAVYTDWGLEIDVLAPGGGLLTCNGRVWSTYPLDKPVQSCTGVPGYGAMSGTSMAAPHAAGVGALLAELGVTGSSAAQLIIDTARKAGSTVLAGGVAGPRLDAAAAVAAVAAN